MPPSRAASPEKATAASQSLGPTTHATGVVVTAPPCARRSQQPGSDSSRTLRTNHPAFPARFVGARAPRGPLELRLQAAQSARAGFRTSMPLLLAEAPTSAVRRRSPITGVSLRAGTTAATPQSSIALSAQSGDSSQAATAAVAIGATSSDGHEIGLADISATFSPPASPAERRQAMRILPAEDQAELTAQMPSALCEGKASSAAGQASQARGRDRGPDGPQRRSQGEAGHRHEPYLTAVAARRRRQGRLQRTSGKSTEM
eukprot:COSAG01_NODE_2973_length_6772_cov_9.646786_3_plen_260_part_00